MQELLDDNGVLIFPTFVSPALYPGESYINICNIIYLGIANALELPSTHCPIGINKAGLPVGLQVCFVQYIGYFSTSRLKTKNIINHTIHIVNYIILDV